MVFGLNFDLKKCLSLIMAWALADVAEWVRCSKSAHDTTTKAIRKSSEYFELLLTLLTVSIGILMLNKYIHTYL